MSERQRLPDRRAAEVFDFEHNGRKWTATSSPASRFKADALSKHCSMHSPEGVRGRWALRWR